MTKLDPTMIVSFPYLNVHVHAPGTIYPVTAIELGLRNNLITIDGGNLVSTALLPDNCPFRGYAQLFRLKAGGKDWFEPNDVEYNLPKGSFKHFDEVMALVQGHRYGIGGIRNADDFRFCMQHYRMKCGNNGLRYVELQQNIELAYAIYPTDNQYVARRKFYELLDEIKDDFSHDGIELRFLNCYNKHAKASSHDGVKENSLRAAGYLKEARKYNPGVIIGLQSAGNETHEYSDPRLHSQGYELARHENFLVDGHAGEAVGVSYLNSTLKELGLKRIGHAFQIIECADTIKRARDQQITIISMPCINQFLGAQISVGQDGKPLAKELGGLPKRLESIWDHPFFPLLREHKLNIGLATDNPGIGGVPVREMLMQLSGWRTDITGEVPEDMQPLNAEELALCALNTIDSAGCSPDTKSKFIRELSQWMVAHNIGPVEHHLLSTWRSSHFGWETQTGRHIQR